MPFLHSLRDLNGFCEALDRDPAQAVADAYDLHRHAVLVCYISLVALAGLSAIMLWPAPLQHYLLAFALVLGVGGVYAVGVVNWWSPAVSQGWPRRLTAEAHLRAFLELAGTPGMADVLPAASRPAMMADLLRMQRQLDDDRHAARAAALAQGVGA